VLLWLDPVTAAVGTGLVVAAVAAGLFRRRMAASQQGRLRPDQTTQSRTLREGT